jgi:predicted metalloendopeptidase
MKKLFWSALCVTALVSCGKQESAPTVALASGVDKANFDTSVHPQDDLYRAIDGTWLAKTEIPADKSNYGSFTKLDDDAKEQIRAIIEAVAAKPNKAPGSSEQKIGDFYNTFMDEAKADELGVGPLKDTFARIDAVSSNAELPSLMAELARIGVPGPLAPYVHQDAKDSTQYAGDFYQFGLSLPDRDYYLIDDEKFRDIRAKYQVHLEKMFTLAGIDNAAAKAKTVYELELKLAKAQWDKNENRDPVKTYNPYPRAELKTLTDKIDWDGFLKSAGYDSLKQVLVSQPTYVQALGDLLASEPLDTWKTYFQWQALSAYSPLLSKPLVEENFAFFSATLNGVQQQRPRWKRGVDAVETAMGEAIGKLYVDQHFPPQNKARMEQLVKNLIATYDTSIDQLEWMSPDTKKAAKEKLGKFTYKIGYPDQWRDYSKLEVVAGDSVGNAMRASAFETDRNLAKLGKPIDRSEWGMTPQTVNAYYNPEMNEIVFPAAILQPPFFNMEAEDAVNYGGIGAVIGHEISHGFDDQGSQYDGDGNLRMWWTDEDRAKFKERTEALAAQYSTYEPVKGYHVDGHFTMGENIADLGGLTIAHRAYLLSLGGKQPPVIDGITGEQRFFMGWAQVWRRKYREQNLLTRLKTDPHSPSEYRCNGVVTNLPEFYAAFDVKEGDKLYKTQDQRIKIW